MNDEGPAGSERSSGDGTPVHQSTSRGTTEQYGVQNGPAGPDEDRNGHAGSADEPDETSWTLFARDILTSVLAVLLVGAYLFAVSGVWPPMVAIESPSMTPNMQTNDLVFVMSEERFPGDGAVEDTGVVTAASGEAVDYTRFNRPGDVIVYRPDGSRTDTPIIHRAMFYVEKGADWTKRANQSHLGRKSSCEQVVDCPASRSGFITLGDGNDVYDQVSTTAGAKTGVVSPDWVIGTAEVRIPGLGWLRLRSG